MTIRAALELDSQNTLTDLLSMHIGGQQTNCVTFQANVAMSSIRMMIWSDADVMMVTGPSDHSWAVCLRCISKASADKLRNPSNHPHHIWPLDVIQTPRIRLTHYIAIQWPHRCVGHVAWAHEGCKGRSQAGSKGQLEVRTQRAPRLLN